MKFERPSGKAAVEGEWSARKERGAGMSVPALSLGCVFRTVSFCISMYFPEVEIAAIISLGRMSIKGYYVSSANEPAFTSCCAVLYSDTNSWKTLVQNLSCTLILPSCRAERWPQPYLPRAGKLWPIVSVHSFPAAQLQPFLCKSPKAAFMLR